jgi:ATP-dependent DNA helicase PIF1
MVDATLFDKLEALARTIRRNERPFGGIQLVITGDFFQLPPVPDNRREAKFTFEAESWSRCIEHTIKLSNVFRQKDQGMSPSHALLILEFVTMLNEMRLGMLSKESIRKFKELQRIPKFDDNIEPTELFATRKEVDTANNLRMHSLSGSTHSFRAEEGGDMLSPQRDRLLENCMAPQAIELKKDVQVMLIKNMDENLVNGSLGKVIGFMSETTYSLCEKEGIDVDSMTNCDRIAGGDDPFGFPTLDGEEEDSESVQRKKRRILKLRAMSADTQLWPLVRFTTATGLHIDRLVTREKWSFEAPDGEVLAYRRQIPLILAYAISIHKAQGQTLSRVRVDLGRVFEKGQAYVALSRATCREGLQILRFDEKKVMAHPKVAGFYRSLENVEKAINKKTLTAEEKNGWNTKALEKLLERNEEDYGLTSSHAYG